MASDPRLKAAHDQLKKIRQRTDLSLKSTPLLKTTFTGFDGEEHPFNLRYYQVQGVLHLVAMNRFLLGDDTGIGKCVVGSTLIRTSRGLLPIKDLNPGLTEADTFGPVEEGLQVEVGDTRCSVASFYYGGEKPTIKIRTRCGYEVEGSQIHPVMVRRDGVDQWVKLRDIQEGDCVAIDRDLGTTVMRETREEPKLPHPGRASNEQGHLIPGEMSPRLALFLGYLVAESWFSRHDRFILCQDSKINPEIHADMDGLTKELFSLEMRPRDRGFEVYSTQLIRFLRSLGSVPGIAKDKEVPWSVLQSTPASMREFLRGYIDAEGHANKLGIEVTSASELLLQQVQVMLLSFGVVCSRNPKMVQGYDHVYWRLTIQGDDVRQFMQTVGLVSRRKVTAIAPLLEKSSNPNYDVVPQAKAEIEDLRAEIYTRSGRHGFKGGGISKRWGSAFYNTLQHVRTGRRNPTYQYLERALEIAREVGISEKNPAYVAVHELVKRNWFYDPIETLEDGWAEVFDLEVKDPRHTFVGNGLVNHNTIQSIASLCFVWAKEPNTKAVILTNKSLVGQWALEFDKFCTPGEINVITCVGTPSKREKTYKEFEAATGPTVLILGYATSRRDIKFLQHWKDFVLIADEASAFKNSSTQTYKVVRHLSRQASRFWGLTATLIKNNLIEGYGIYSLLVPGLFPSSKNKFMMEYCLTRLQPIPGTRRQIPVIIGYRKDQIERFKEKIDPYFLSRAKFDVAKELPVLQIKQHKCGMSRAQEAKYREALEGLFEKDLLGEEIETTKLTALIYCQQIVDHPELVDCEGTSDKMDELFTLLTEGDLADEKVVVFSRFRKMIDKLEETAHSKKYKLKTVRITGTENEEERKTAMLDFQNEKSDTRICWITEAAKEGINLQAAKALVFYDSPWSAGDYLQILGRIVRIGSTHDRCYAIHLVAKGTIDTKVMSVLRTKMKLIEAVMGKRLKGEGMEDVTVSADNSIDDIFASLQAEARKYA